MKNDKDNLSKETNKLIIKTSIYELISAIFILLRKYSSYISDSVTLKFIINDSLSINISKTLLDTVNFHEFQQEIEKELKSTLKDSIDLGDELKIIWVSENKSEEIQYQIELLKIEEDQFSISFISKAKAFYEIVFQKANEHLNNIIKCVLQNSEILISDINYYSYKEEQSINSTQEFSDLNSSQNGLLITLFEKTAVKYPNRNAVVTNTTSITYKELNNQANNFAEKLIEKNVKPGDFVGILLKRSPEFYISMLAVLKAGAAYVPLDTNSPEDRIEYILNDSEVKLLITNTNSFPDSLDIDCEKIYFDDKLLVSTKKFSKNITQNFLATSDLPAYIIYTSGTTGRPKGVVISNSSIYNLVKEEEDIYHVANQDRVLQGFTVAFDASLEEIWMAFNSGAALYPADEEVMHSGTELSKFISKNKITVISTVPTMLSMMKPPLSSLRILILGGENCSTELLQRWYNNKLRIFNTYGPTESTVIATYDEFNIDKNITIGKPLKSYSAYVLDQNLLPVPTGVAGELCISGAGLAIGYLNQKKLTDEKFIISKFSYRNNLPERIYRTGDLVRFNETGNLEFLGRIDSQIKLRGYRIELSEIESQIMQIDEIENAVVAVKEDEYNVQWLVAYVLLKAKDKPFDESRCREFLKSRLVSYMIPAVFMVLDEFPLLQSGKIDKKKLPEPKINADNNREIIEPRNLTEKLIYAVWKNHFPTQTISVTDDFFDLGGHSLLASMVISSLRKNLLFSRISVQDIYTFRTIENLAAEINSSEPHDANEKTEAKKIKKTSKLTFILTTATQILSIIFFYLIPTIGLLAPVIIEQNNIMHDPYLGYLLSVLILIMILPINMLLSIIFKWLLIGRFKEGVYPLWGWYYCRFWFVKKMVDLSALALFTGTPFINIYFRLMGAKIGKGVYLGSPLIRVFDLTKIGDNSSFSKEANLIGYKVENGTLIIGKINVGENCYVGARSVVSPNSEMEDFSSLGELSLLPSNTTIPKNEYWKGSPAAKIIINENIKVSVNKKRNKNIPYPIYFIIQFLATTFVTTFPFLLIIPFLALFHEIEINFGFEWSLISLIPSTGIYIISFCLIIALFKWIIVGKVKEEDFGIYSIRYIQKWIVDNLINMSLLYFRSVYATIYLPSWLRLLGAKIGKASEISTVNQLNTDLLEIGDGSFLADSVSIGAPVVKNKIMSLKKISIGEKTFIGNSAVVSYGNKIGNNSLIGVLSVPPFKKEDALRNDSSWLGSPSMFLPQRQQSEPFPDKLKFHPTKDLYIKRGAIEIVKITLPYIISSMLVVIFYSILPIDLFNQNWILFGIVSTLLLFLLMLITPVITYIFKKMLINKYRPVNKPLWSLFVWKNELINSLCENMVYPLLVSTLLGTPFAPIFFRMMGCKIGKKVFMETTEITEFDMVSIGDEVSLNYLATIQTHLFEDRVMKISHLNIGNNCNIGSMSVVLYDSVMEENSSIDALTLVMKGEIIPAKSRWAGSPAKFVKAL